MSRRRSGNGAEGDPENGAEGDKRKKQEQHPQEKTKAQDTARSGGATGGDLAARKHSREKKLKMQYRMVGTPPVATGPAAWQATACRSRTPRQHKRKKACGRQTRRRHDLAQGPKQNIYKSNIQIGPMCQIGVKGAGQLAEGWVGPKVAPQRATPEPAALSRWCRKDTGPTSRKTETQEESATQECGSRKPKKPGKKDGAGAAERSRAEEPQRRNRA